MKACDARVLRRELTAKEKRRRCWTVTLEAFWGTRPEGFGEHGHFLAAARDKAGDGALAVSLGGRSSQRCDGGQDTQEALVYIVYVLGFSLE